VGDVQDAVRGQLGAGRGHQEAATGRAKDLHHLGDLGRLGPGQAGDLAEGHGPAGVALGAVLHANGALCQAAEQDLGNAPLLLVELGEGRFQMPVEGLAQAPQRFQSRQGEDSVRPRLVPEPHQEVLQQGQMILLVRGLRQQALYQLGRDLAVESRQAGGELDGVGELLGGQARGQEQAGVDGLGQVRVAGAVAQVLGA